MIWLVVLVGCTGASPTSDARTATGSSGDSGNPCGPGGLVLGSGADSHHPLSKGDHVVLVHGPQNGWHIDLSAELRRPGEVMGFEGRVVTVDDDVQIGGQQPVIYLGFEDVEGCTAQAAGLRILIDDLPEPKGGYQAFICGLADRVLEVELTSRDLDRKESFTEHVQVRAALDKVDATYNCPLP